MARERILGPIGTWVVANEEDPVSHYRCNYCHEELPLVPPLNQPDDQHECTQMRDYVAKWDAARDPAIAAADEVRRLAAIDRLASARATRDAAAARLPGLQAVALRSQRKVAVLAPHPAQLTALDAELEASTGYDAAVAATVKELEGLAPMIQADEAAVRVAHTVPGIEVTLRLGSRGLEHFYAAVGKAVA